MNTKNTIVSGLAAVAGLSLMACSSLTGMGPAGGSPGGGVSNEPTTTFKCIQADRGWATVAERGNAVSKNPLFTWNSEEFGDNWTPENRCYEVTRRLNVFVGKNGGRLSNLSLTPGQVNGLTVVCVVNQQSSCTNDSLLFTLSQKNAATPRTAIAKITDFSKGKANASPVDENGYPQYFPLQDLVNFSPEEGF
ncbi:COP23 domain-containing protein [[Phormidium] sp. ETS-05]|uniref:COP23 domain-containing protein n=1 Tax=[Phormidium] sp. ETS-05 TaxID=222819 RepID=UPI0018EEF47F|nr:COP23 domain-containing protein [[Phormidium] sp. ETS-05]